MSRAQRVWLDCNRPFTIASFEEALKCASDYARIDVSGKSRRIVKPNDRSKGLFEVGLGPIPVGPIPILLEWATANI